MSKSPKTLLGFGLLGFVGVWMGCSSDASPVAPQAAGKTHLTLTSPTDSDGDGIPDVDSDGDGIPDADSTPTYVAFADSSLERAVRTALGSRVGGDSTLSLMDPAVPPLRPTDLATLTKLDASNRGIQSLAGLQYATNLDTLNLGGNKKISDWSPLASLTKLENLSLYDNSITALSPLASLTKLERLDLTNNKISDLRPLTSLTKLEGLFMYANKISDLSPLASLTNLTHLQIGENEAISDWSPLASLPNLKWLKARGTGIDNAKLRSFENLPKLEWLNLSSNPITNLYPLTCLPNLKKLLLRKVIPDRIDSTNVHVLYLKAKEPEPVKVSWNY